MVPVTITLRRTIAGCDNSWAFRDSCYRVRRHLQTVNHFIGPMQSIHVRWPDASMRASIAFCGCCKRLSCCALVRAGEPRPCVRVLRNIASAIRPSRDCGRNGCFHRGADRVFARRCGNRKPRIHGRSRYVQNGCASRAANILTAKLPHQCRCALHTAWAHAPSSPSMSCVTLRRCAK